MTRNPDIGALARKLSGLSPKRIAEVEDFVDFLAQRDADNALIAQAQKASKQVLAKIWDNPGDSDYDRL